MKLQRCAYPLLANGLIATALVCTAGVAQAQPDPVPPWVPSVIDQLITQTPALWVNPTDEGGESAKWGGTGMYCLNLSVRCRR
jgi:hypothetical protein